MIEADAPNNYQQIVTFSDGERLLVNNSDLASLNDAIVSESSGRTYPKEYSEAIAAIEEHHKQELERLSQELRIGLQTEAAAKAEAQVQEQIQSLQQLFKQQKEENIQLQQRLGEREGLRKPETENQQLQQRIQELEHAVEQRPSQEWGNTMTQQATKVLNKQVKQALEKTIDLRSLALEPPKENAQECLRLMGMALKNLASAMNNTQALEAAAIILGSEPTPIAIASFPDAAIALFLLVSLLCLHNTLNLDLAKPYRTHLGIRFLRCDRFGPLLISTQSSNQAYNQKKLGYTFVRPMQKYVLRVLRSPIALL
ncbi:MAG: hypothetical protein V7K45_07845 [Nostoc sp.]